MVKRSRVYSSSSNSSRCAAVLLVLYLLCGVAFGSSVGRRSLIAERNSNIRDAEEAAAGPRNERSTANLSHITGTARKIKMFIKNRYLQVYPDGTVNSTTEDTSDYVILQRASVNTGQLKIQGVATCMYLCMDACGLLYGSKDFDEECVFNEMIEQNHYNTYSSAKYTNDRRTLYLALNKRGTPRKVHVKANAPLGKLSTYTRVLTQPVPVQRVDELLASRRPVGDWPIHGLRHHHVCPPHVGPPLTKHKNKQRKCGNSKFNGRRKKDEMIGGSKGNREDEDCKKNRCDDVSHRKVDASGRKKNLSTSAKKSGTTAKSKGKTKKTEPEPVLPPEPVVMPVAVVTTVVPSQLDDDDVDADAPATAPSDEFLESNEN